MQRPTKVEFHENGKTYFWHIPSSTVTDERGGIISRHCYNLTMARAAVNRKQ